MVLTANFHPTTPATQTLTNTYQGEALDYLTKMLERTYPANYIVAKVGSTHYCYKASTGGKIADTATALTAIQAGVDAAAADGGGIVHVKAGTYDLANTIIDVGTGSGVWLRGEGMGVTTFLNGGILKGNSTVQNNWTFSDFTVDVNDTAGKTGLNLASNSTDYLVSRVELKDTADQFLMYWSQVDNCRFTDCRFIDGGRGIANGKDNCAGTQVTTNEKVTVFRHCYFQKDLSLGGGMLTTGGCGNLLVDGCTMVDNSANSYAALSIENSFGPCKDIMVSGLRGDGKNMRIQIGISAGDAVGGTNPARGPIRRGIVTGSNCSQGIMIRNAGEALIANSMCHDSWDIGFVFINDVQATLSNCIAKNTNLGASASPADKGGLYYDNVGSLTVSNFHCYDDQTTATTPQGIRAGSTNTTARTIFSNIQLDGPFTTNSFRTGSGLYVRVYGGRFTGGAVSITATDAKFFDVDGYKTQCNVLSPTFTINATGMKTVTIPHGLSITPAKEDCTLTVLENTNVDDWKFDFLKVDAVDATNVTAKINVSVASATAGAVANLGLRCSKFG